VITAVESGSLAEEHGIEPGMLITDVNRQSVRNVRQFNDALGKARKEGKVLLRVFSENWAKIILIPLPEK
jgi:S1-C subfamily serine protease